MKDLITKSAKVEGLAVTEAELELINKYTIEPLTADKIFTFKVAICDNEIDRDFEVFPTESLKKMAELFVGKTIMKDHRGQTDNQVARIYATEVVEKDGISKTGEKYTQLVAHCYMVKTESNSDLITEIQAGIKKEVSVGCAIGSAVCSVCGVDNRNAYCKHFNGNEYDGKLCYFKLLNPKDAYEVSFVAVPAQPKAGVTKSYTGEEVKKEPEQINTENEDLIDSELGIIKSFIFVENQKHEMR